MSDLRSRLHDVVDVGDPLPGTTRGATASDDVLVGLLTSRVRRRRGLRGATAGALGVVTVAAVVAGGYALAGGGARDVPPATDTTAPTVAGPTTLMCGAAVDTHTLDPVADGLRFAGLELGAPTVAEDEPLVIDVTIVNDTARGLADVEVRPVVEVAALSRGVVVATTSIRMGTGPFDPGAPWGANQEGLLDPCPRGGLVAGDHELVAVVTVTPGGAGAVPTVLSLGPVPFTVTPATTPTPEPALVCGAQLPAELPTDPALAVVAGVAASATTGGGVPWSVGWWSPSADATELRLADVQLATVRDGFVVGSTHVSATYTGTGQQIPATEDTALALSDTAPAVGCGAEPLPPGDYRAVLVLTLVTADGEVLRTATVPQPLTITRG